LVAEPFPLAKFILYIYSSYIVKVDTFEFYLPYHKKKAKKEDTLVFYGVKTVINIVIEFLNQTNNVVYACVDQTRPILALDILVLKKAIAAIPCELLFPINIGNPSNIN
jgi:hypothetical protein